MKTEEDLVSYCLQFVDANQRQELKVFLESVLRKYAAAELKGLFRKQAGLFFSSKAAQTFLKSTLERLTT